MSGLQRKKYTGKQQRCLVSSQLCHFLADIAELLSQTKAYGEIYASFSPFSYYDSYKAGKTSVPNNNNSKIFPSKPQFYIFCFLFSVWIHSWFEVWSSSVVPENRGWALRLDELISLMKGHHQMTDHHMTSSSQWPQPVPGTRRRCSGPTQCLSVTGTRKNESCKNVYKPFP